MLGSRWLHNCCYCCRNTQFDFNNVDYSYYGYRPLLKLSDFTHPSTWPSFDDLPPPKDWKAEFDKLLVK